MKIPFFSRRNLKKLAESLRNISSQILILLTFLFSPISLLLRFLGFRVVVHGSVIGNICTQIDAYAKEQLLHRFGRKKLVLFPHFNSIFSSKPFQLNTCNNYLFSLWKKHFWVVTNPFLAFFLNPILKAAWLALPNSYLSEKPNLSFYAVTRDYYQKFPDFSQKNSILKIPEKDQKRGLSLLKKWGLTEKDWFVCFYTREPGYYNLKDFHSQAPIRNVDIMTYRKALLEILKRGGTCIRIGSPLMKPLPPEITQLGKVIDYPKNSEASDFMDVFLLANCRFMLTCSSGISLLPGLFGVPILMTNVIPLHVAVPLYPRDLSLIKRTYSKRYQRELTFSEAFSLFVTDQVDVYYYQSLALEVTDNTEEEIREATLEMLDRLEGIYQENKDALWLQEQFKKTIPEYLFCKDGLGKIGYQFLKRHQALLENVPKTSAGFSKG